MADMAQPRLAIVVDTEEEFDWSKPFSRDNVGTRSVLAQSGAQEVYERFGIVPTYVIVYPVATDPEAAGFLRKLRREGKAEIGAHLHPWVTPPLEEQVTNRNSYHCNLAPDLERRKIEQLTAAIEASFGERPTIFKAGRHGFGANTRKVLAELGYKVDCSYVPFTDFSRDEGPDYRGVPHQPFWLDAERELLEIPVTTGYFGALPRFGARAQWLFDNRNAQRLRAPGLLSKAGIVTRSRLTPEGVPAAEQCALLEALVEQGNSIFTLVYHSSSLAPGHTPYVRSQDDLAGFLGSIETVLAFFRDRLGGRFTTLSEIHREQPRLAISAASKRRLPRNFQTMRLR